MIPENCPVVHLGGRAFRLLFHMYIKPSDRANLRRSVMEKGFEVPIVVDQHDNVIDGANRLQICVELGMPLSSLQIKTRHCESLEKAEELCWELNAHRRHWWSPEEQERQVELRRIRVAELRKQGMTMREIAEEVGVSHVTIVNDTKACAVAPGKPLPGATAVPSAKEEEQMQRQKRVVELRDNGMSLRKIAKELGIQVWTVQSDLKKAGTKKPEEEKIEEGKTEGENTASKKSRSVRIGKKKSTDAIREKIRAAEEEWVANGIHPYRKPLEVEDVAETLAALDKITDFCQQYNKLPQLKTLFLLLGTLRAKCERAANAE